MAKSVMLSITPNIFDGAVCLENNIGFKLFAF